MAAKVVDKELKKAEILHAAMHVFSQKGVAKTKMADIATAAGIGKGTIYEYFRSKEELFSQAFLSFFTKVENGITESLQDSDDPVEKLRALIFISLQILLEANTDFSGIIMDFWAEGVRNKDEKMLAIIDLEQIYAKYRFIISGILNDGIRKGIFRQVDVNSLAAIIIAAMDGIMLQWIMNKNAIDIKKVSEVLLDSLLQGIEKKENN